MKNFSNYRQIISQFAGTATCGHPITKGDAIGWASGRRREKSETQCKDCWVRWSAENREAADYEAALPAGM